MEVNIYCYLSAPAVERHKRKAYLKEFLSDISGYLRVLGQTFVIVWGGSDLAPEPNYLQPEFVEGSVLLLPFSFQYFELEQAYLQLSLIRTTMENLIYKKGVEMTFEYHLDE